MNTESKVGIVQPLMSEPRFCGTHPSDVAVERAAWEARDRVLAEIDRLDLHDHVRRLEVDGYTILPPERVAPKSFIDDMRETILEISAKDAGNGLTIKADEINTESDSFGQTKYVVGMLKHGRVFEQALMNEATLALTTYLLGESCMVHEVLGLIKGPGTEFMGLHTDQNHQGTPAPFPAMAQMANVTWALTDYDEANGATCFVAGSHKLCRPPSPYEARDLSLFRPVTAPAGSVLVWHGNTWHGSLPRRNPGFRISVIYDFVRWYNRVGDAIAPTLPPEAFARNPARFGILTGATPIRTTTGQGRAAILGHYA